MSLRTPGRPRSEASRLAVLGAAVEVATEEGPRALTMEGVARRAGVSKQTVYRWWHSPAAILLDALNEGAAALAPLERTGDLDRDVRAFVRRSVRGTHDGVARMLATLMAEAQRDPRFGAEFREGFLGVRRQVLRSLLEHARDDGEIGADVDLDLAVELCYGPLWYRLLADSGPLDDAFADGLSSVLLGHLRGRPGASDR